MEIKCLAEGHHTLNQLGFRLLILGLKEEQSITQLTSMLYELGWRKDTMSGCAV